MAKSPSKPSPKKTRASAKPRLTSAAATRQRDWKPIFLAALAKRGNVSEAAKAAGVHRDTANEHRKTDAAFLARWESALEDAADALEREAFRRAHDGVVKPVFGSGGPGVGTVEVGHVREYSDTLLIFLLKGIRPAKYRDNFNVTGSVAVTQVTSDEMAKARAEADAWEREKFGNGS